MKSMTYHPSPEPDNHADIRPLTSANHPSHTQIVTVIYDLLTEAGLNHQMVVNLATEAMGEQLACSCLICALAANDESIGAAALYETDPQLHSLMVATATHVPLPVDLTVLSQQVFESATSLLLSVVDIPSLVAATKAEFRSVVEQAQIHTLLILPMRTQKQVRGLLYLWRHQQRQPAFLEADRQLAQDLADRIALIMTNAQLHQELQEQLAQRREAEQLLRIAIQEKEEALAQLDALFSSTPLGMGIWDKDFKLIRINQALAELNKFPIADGTDGWADDPVADVDGRDQLLPIWQWILQTGKPRLNLTHTLVSRTGDYKYLTGNFFPVYRGQSIIGIGASVLDITERKQAEAERNSLAEQLLQSQKMETIGRLAGGVAHDFNNLLTVIQGYSDLLIRQIPPTSPWRSKLEQIQRAGKRASLLTSQLLAFGRKQILMPTTVDLNGVIGDLQSMVQRLIGEDIALQTKLAPDLRSVTADRGQLEQAIMNLVVNAREAMATGGQLTITTRNGHIDPTQFPAPMELPPGDCVLLTVHDTGSGIPEAIRTQIFEPFFTTKPKGQGTGLGLSTVFGIVKQSGGDIQVESVVGEGSAFTIYLPATQEPVSAEAESLLKAPLTPNYATILVVEDEELVRDLVANTLHDEGYTVLKACSGPDALALVEEQLHQIDLLLTDVVMPEMSGRELAQQLCARHPHLCVLFTSGYTDDAVMRHGISRAEVAFLQKPYLPSMLIAKVRSVLDEAKVKR